MCGLMVVLKSTQMRISPLDFLAQTIGDAHSIGVVDTSTASMTPCSTRRSNSASTALLIGKGIGRAECAFGIAPLFKRTAALCPMIVLGSSSNSCPNSVISACLYFRIQLSL